MSRVRRWAPCLALLASTTSPVRDARAGELNWAALRSYSSGEAQLTSIRQFSELRPSDWAYQALSNLVERYGCVAGYPNGTFKPGQAISRFEAAALLNACLDRITETTDELQKLISEFGTERAVLRGRVDALETKIGALEANPFSTTTKLSGLATFVMGANQFNGSAINRSANSVNRRPRDNGTPRPPVPLGNATLFSYDLQLTLDTSFSGKDLLRTNLRAGNFGDNVFGGEPHALGLSQLEIAFEQDCGTGDCGDVVAIDKLYYQWPIGGGFTATVGPRVGQEDMLALWPSAYPADTILNVLTVNGAPAAYNKNLGAGAGLWWQSNGWSLSANYVAAQADIGNPELGGIANRASGSTGTVQLAYGRNQWGVAAIWSQVQPETQFIPGATPFTHSAIDHNPAALTQAFGLSGYWQPHQAGIWPSLSLGWGINQTRYSRPQPAGSLQTSQSWMVGLQWTDLFRHGNDFGIGVGQPVFATSLSGGSRPDDGNYVWEWWYKFQVTDHISVTPALIYLSRPLGMTTPSGQSFSQFGGLIKTSFRF